MCGYDLNRKFGSIGTIEVHAGLGVGEQEGGKGMWAFFLHFLCIQIRGKADSRIMTQKTKKTDCMDTRLD